MVISKVFQVCLLFGEWFVCHLIQFEVLLCMK